MRLSVFKLLVLTASCFSFISTPACFAVPQNDPPNILFILVDDLGKEWVSCYGAEGINTPHIDALAEGGMKFNNAWCMPQCTPTRVTLLTGQYPFRHGWTNHWDVPRWGSGAHFDAKLNSSYARVLRAAGYATCAAGKWQIDDYRVEPDAMNEAGFDAWCMWTGYESGNPPSEKRYWDPYINTQGQGSKTHKGAFGPDIYCDYLVNFISDHKHEPMLLYYPMVLTHGPLTTTPDNKEKNEKDKQAQFAGMVRYTDKLIGRLVGALDNAKIRDNTIIIFTTDNGTGGQRNKRLGRLVRGGKAKMSEQNGTAQPFIVNCPGKVAAGVETDALIDFTDILPTLAELSGGTLPSNRVIDGQSFAPLLLGQAKDGPRSWIMSMGGGAATMKGGRVVPKLNYDDRVLRDKRFKLWIGTDGKPAKIFDLIADPWEERNLIESNSPEAIEALHRLSAVARTFPEKDGAPIYDENPPQTWDKNN